MAHALYTAHRDTSHMAHALYTAHRTSHIAHRTSHIAHRTRGALYTAHRTRAEHSARQAIGEKGSFCRGDLKTISRVSVSVATMVTWVAKGDLFVCFAGRRSGVGENERVGRRGGEGRRERFAWNSETARLHSSRARSHCEEAEGTHEGLEFVCVVTAMFYDRVLDTGRAITNNCVDECTQGRRRGVKSEQISGEWVWRKRKKTTEVKPSSRVSFLCVFFWREVTLFVCVFSESEVTLCVCVFSAKAK
jgi:hypothetical protein